MDDPPEPFGASTKDATSFDTRPTNVFPLISFERAVNESEFEEDEDGEEEEEEQSDAGSDPSGVLFKTKPKLPSPNVVKRSLEELTELMKGDYLDLNPEYQRDVVWGKERMVGLIDSLMENYYIPPVIFNMIRVQDHNGNTIFKRICVDGKQRLSSIKAFMEGRIGCHDSRHKTWFYTGSRRKTLPENVKDEFRRKEIVCYEIMDLSSTQEQDLFSRVQLGVQLTPAEKLRAQTGKWQGLAKEFERDFSSVLELCRTQRARGFQNILTCFAMILECQNSAKNEPSFKSGFQVLKRFESDSRSLKPATEKHLRRVFMIFQELIGRYATVFVDMSRKRTAKTTIAPMELIATSVLISQWADTRNHFLLSNDIRNMRKYVRSFTPDVFTNSTTWKHFWDYIENLESHRGAVDSSTLPLDTNKEVSAEAQPKVPVTAAELHKRVRFRVSLPWRFASTPKQCVRCHTRSYQCDSEPQCRRCVKDGIRCVYSDKTKPLVDTGLLKRKTPVDVPIASGKRARTESIGPSVPLPRPRNPGTQTDLTYQSRESSLVSEIREHLPTPTSPGAQPRKRGRPRLHRPLAPDTPKRPRGRPRKDTNTRSTTISTGRTIPMDSDYVIDRPEGTPTQSRVNKLMPGTYQFTPAPQRSVEPERSWARVARGGPGKKPPVTTVQASPQMSIRSGTPDSVIGGDSDGEDDTEDEVFRPKPFPELVKSSLARTPTAHMVAPRSSTLNSTSAEPFPAPNQSLLLGTQSATPNTGPVKIPSSTTGPQTHSPSVKPRTPVIQLIKNELTTPGSQPSRTNENQAPSLFHEPVSSPPAAGEPLSIVGVSQAISLGPAVCMATEAQNSAIQSQNGTSSGQSTPRYNVPLLSDLTTNKGQNSANQSPNPSTSSKQTTPSAHIAPLPAMTLETNGEAQVDAKPNIEPYFNSFQSGGAKALAERRRLKREQRLAKQPQA